MKYIKDTATLKYNSEKCTGCGLCTTVCPHGVFEIVNKKAEIKDKDRCMECGACMINCPVKAIQVDKGVGCAYAVIVSKIRGSKEISCDCGCSGSDEKKNSLRKNTGKRSMIIKDCCSGKNRCC